MPKNRVAPKKPNNIQRCRLLIFLTEKERTKHITKVENDQMAMAKRVYFKDRSTYKPVQRPTKKIIAVAGNLRFVWCSIVGIKQIIH